MTQKTLSAYQWYCRRPQQLDLFVQQSQLESCPQDLSKDSRSLLAQSSLSEQSIHAHLSRRTNAKMISMGFIRKRTTVAVNDAGIPVGEDHVAAKYLDSDVTCARELREEGYTLRQISQMLDMPIRTLRGYLDGSRRCQSVAGFKVVKRWIKRN